MLASLGGQYVCQFLLKNKIGHGLEKRVNWNGMTYMQTREEDVPVHMGTYA